MITEIQCLPRPSGTPDDTYAHVHAAIELIESSGLTYEVGALGTTIEGEPDEIWPLLRRVHEACLAAGADSVISVIKVAETGTISGTISGTTEAPPTISGLTQRYR